MHRWEWWTGKGREEMGSLPSDENIQRPAIKGRGEEACPPPCSQELLQLSRPESFHSAYAAPEEEANHSLARWSFPDMEITPSTPRPLKQNYGLSSSPLPPKSSTSQSSLAPQLQGFFPQTRGRAQLQDSQAEEIKAPRATFLRG